MIDGVPYEFITSDVDEHLERGITTETKTAAKIRTVDDEPYENLVEAYVKKGLEDYENLVKAGVIVDGQIIEDWPKPGSFHGTLGYETRDEVNDLIAWLTEGGIDHDVKLIADPERATQAVNARLKTFGLQRREPGTTRRYGPAPARQTETTTSLEPIPMENNPIGEETRVAKSLKILNKFSELPNVDEHTMFVGKITSIDQGIKICKQKIGHLPSVGYEVCIDRGTVKADSYPGKIKAYCPYRTYLRNTGAEFRLWTWIDVGPQHIDIHNTNSNIHQQAKSLWELKRYSGSFESSDTKPRPKPKACPKCGNVILTRHPQWNSTHKGIYRCPQCGEAISTVYITPHKGSWADEEAKRKETLKSQTISNVQGNRIAQVIPADGFADGGDQYTNEELELMQKPTVHNSNSPTESNILANAHEIINIPSRGKMHRCKFCWKDVDITDNGFKPYDGISKYPHARDCQWQGKF
jgi:DNA-directed RNA polymerase subunit M/transcription elongation factor TFIIS